MLAPPEARFFCVSWVLRGCFPTQKSPKCTQNTKFSAPPAGILWYKYTIYIVITENRIKTSKTPNYISWSILRWHQYPGSKLKKRRLVMTPPTNFADKLPTTPETRYSGRHGLELFKTVRLAFIGSIFVKISYRKLH